MEEYSAHRSSLHHRLTAIIVATIRGRSRTKVGVVRGILVLFVDDVQWSDPATLEFLSYLARRVVSEPVLLLFVYRREDSL